MDFESFFGLLPEKNRFWHYLGGLTTPGCGEVVNWHINKNIIMVNTAQLAKFRALWVTPTTFNGNTFATGVNSGKKQGNNRWIQPLGTRHMHGGEYTVRVGAKPEGSGGMIRMLIIVVLVAWVVIFIMNFVIYKMKAGNGAAKGEKTH